MTGIEAKGSKARSSDGSSSVGHKKLPTLVRRRGREVKVLLATSGRRLQERSLEIGRGGHDVGGSEGDRMPVVVVVLVDRPRFLRCLFERRARTE